MTMSLDQRSPKGRAGRRLAQDKIRHETEKRAAKVTLCRTPGCRMPAIDGEDYCKGCREFFIGDDDIFEDDR
jgi:hypothetical protein